MKHNNKIIFYLLIGVIFFGNLSYSQGESLSILEMPKVAPVSPEAASLGKYGDLPVNLASGRINYTIPIYTIDVNGFSYPITLSYNHGGLLAEEDVSMVGLGWTLHAGGAIIRQLRGKPDEGSQGYVAGDIGKDYVVPFITHGFNSMPVEEREIFLNNFFSDVATNVKDAQPDKFVISAGALSANFYHDENGDFVFRPHKNFQVSKPTVDSYKVIDDKGVSYEFMYPELTTSEPITNSEQLSPIMMYNSSWALSRIKLPVSNQTIDFEYSPGDDYHKQGISKSYRELTGYDQGAPNVSNPCSSAQPVKTSYYETIITGKNQISKISFPDGELHFDVRTAPAPPSSLNTTNTYLHSISLYDTFGEKIKSYTFTYDDVSSNYKLLQKIDVYGENDSWYADYDLEYYGTPPSIINSSNQDVWGYYSTTALTGFNNTPLGRKAVSHEKTLLGALKRITYPTGGYSEISYEQNRVYELPDDFSATGIEFNYDTTVEVLANNSNPTPPALNINLPFKQTVSVFVSAQTGQTGMCESEASFSYYDPTKYPYNFGQTASAWNELDSQTNTTPDPNTFGYYEEVPANTSLHLEAFLQGCTSNASGSAQVILKYNQVKQDVYVGGIRVASTKDCSETGDCISKNYNYIDNNGNESGKLLSNPVHYNDIHVNESNGYKCYFRVHGSASKVPLASFQGAPVLYPRVEILQNGTTQNGKTVKYFTYHENPVVNDPFPPVDTQDWKKGQLLREEYYVNDNPLDIVKTIDNNYVSAYPPLLSSQGLAVSQFSFGGLNTSASWFVFSDYENKPEFYHLTKSTIKNYLNGQEAVQETDYTYDTLTGNLRTQSITNSQGEHQVTSFAYPMDVTSLNSLGNSSLTQAEYDAILLLSSPTLTNPNGQNRISEPIQTATYLDINLNDILEENELIGLQRTNYKDWGNSIVLPETIAVSKNGLELKDKIEFIDYNDAGNPIEVSKADGTHIVYVWGYNKTQPIAKIENATYAQVLSSVSNLQSLSDADNDRTIGNLGQEGQLRQALDTLRTSLLDAMVTTFTYDPLIGVTSITDAKGYVMYYDYDDFGRLKHVKDEDGNILSKNEYNYRPQSQN